MKKTVQEVFREFTTGTKNHLTTQISDIAPDVEDYIINFVFGEAYAREDHTKQEKALTTITARAARSASCPACVASAALLSGANSMAL